MRDLNTQEIENDRLLKRSMSPIKFITRDSLERRFFFSELVKHIFLGYFA